MGLWGAAQAIAFGCGGVFATILVDIAKLIVGAPLAAYAIVFIGEAALFIVSAVLASRIASPQAARASVSIPAHAATAQS
jgi:BCD family chlorophyll transporter-like MFS transporter